MRSIAWYCCIIPLVMLSREGQALVTTPFVRFVQTGLSCPVSSGLSSTFRGRVASSAAIAHGSGPNRSGHHTRGRLQPLLSAVDTVVSSEVLDVAIVGAGPAGLALAVGLRGKGLRVKVFEAAPEIKARGAAVFLQAS